MLPAKRLPQIVFNVPLYSFYRVINSYIVWYNELKYNRVRSRRFDESKKHRVLLSWAAFKFQFDWNFTFFYTKRNFSTIIYYLIPWHKVRCIQFDDTEKWLKQQTMTANASGQDKTRLFLLSATKYYYSFTHSIANRDDKEIVISIHWLQCD